MSDGFFDHRPSFAVWTAKRFSRVRHIARVRDLIDETWVTLSLGCAHHQTFDLVNALILHWHVPDLRSKAPCMKSPASCQRSRNWLRSSPG